MKVNLEGLDTEDRGDLIRQLAERVRVAARRELVPAAQIKAFEVRRIQFGEGGTDGPEQHGGGCLRRGGRAEPIE